MRFLGEIYAGNVVNLLYNLSQCSQVSSTHFHSITSIQFTDFKWKWEGFFLLPLFLLLSQFPLNSLNMFPLRRLHFKQEFLSLLHTFHELSMSCLLPLNCTGWDVLTDLYQPTENQVNHLFQCPLTFSLFTNISFPYIQRLNHHR